MTETIKSLNLIVGAAASSLPAAEVVILYEDFSTGLKAKHVFDHLFLPSGSGEPYHLNMWKFNVLRLAALRAESLRDAASAVIICVSAHKGADLPLGLEQWARDWARQIPKQPCALVTLLEANGASSDDGLPLVPFLRQLAAQRAAQFFLGSTLPDEQANKLNSAPPL